MQSTNTLVTRKFRTTRLESSASHQHRQHVQTGFLWIHIFQGKQIFPSTNRLSQLRRAIFLLSKSMGIMFQDGNKKQGFRIFEYQRELLSVRPKKAHLETSVPGQSLLSSPPNPPAIPRPSGRGLFGGQVLPQHGEEGALQDVGEDPSAEPPEEDARDPVLARRRNGANGRENVTSLWCQLDVGFGNMI